MKIVVLDRDGVINEDSDEFVKTVDEWIPIDGSIEAIARLYEHGFTIAVATNQSGIGRGLFTIDDLEDMHEKLLELVRDAGGDIATIVYCPHKPEDLCDCRKPQSGLFDEIAATIGSDLEGAWTIGDSLRDLQAGMARGCKPVLVRTGKGARTEQQLEDDDSGEFDDVPVLDNLSEAADYLISQTPPDIVQEWLDDEY
ncbi:MAG TPA: D-glycero-beta-D-manno-heptose 1,7-bisphosphate 7-phosphatase [Pseudomonadales bacterium]|nr:D-glycero-beta-D-manno-heptose 1,7-bisphosphate 7-phosphatase [Pseudomonadales bacterium]